MVYMGWGPGDAEIDWMNEVLAAHPERIAIINQHEFMLTTGGLGAMPQRIMDEVVATNPNVKLVFSGHYHDAFTRVDEFDDDGDGIPDRTVNSMLFDYQGLPEGGQGFLRLLHFDNETGQMLVRTYSASLDQYNSDEASLLGPVDDPNLYQEFEVSYDVLGIAPATKTLATDAFSAEILTANEIAGFSDVPSGSVLTATWPLEELGEHGWYVRTADPYGAVDFSAVRLFTVIPAAVVEEPEEPTDPPSNGGGNGSGGGGGGGNGSGNGGGGGGSGSGEPAGGGSSPVGAGSGSGSGAGALAVTGLSAGPVGLIGLGTLAALLAGIGLMLFRRSRRGSRVPEQLPE